MSLFLGGGFIAENSDLRKISMLFLLCNDFSCFNEMQEMTYAIQKFMSTLAMQF